MQVREKRTFCCFVPSYFFSEGFLIGFEPRQTGAFFGAGSSSDAQAKDAITSSKTKNRWKKTKHQQKIEIAVLYVFIYGGILIAFKDRIRIISVEKNRKVNFIVKQQ